MPSTRHLVDALNADVSYAVAGGCGSAVGQVRRAAQAFEVLQAKVTTKPEVHVMIATLNALAATKDPRAANILLAEAQPGVPERIRLNALAALAGLKGTVEQDHLQELVEVVRAALHDPFFPIQEAGEELVGAFHLVQFKADIQAEAQDAPTYMQREPAREVLDQLNHPE